MFGYNSFELVAFGGTILDSVGFISQAYLCVSSCSAKDVSTWFLVLKFSSSMLWMFVSFELNWIPLFVASIVSFVCTSIMMIVKARTECTRLRSLRYENEIRDID